MRVRRTKEGYAKSFPTYSVTAASVFLATQSIKSRSCSDEQHKAGEAHGLNIEREEVQQLHK